LADAETASVEVGPAPKKRRTKTIAELAADANTAVEDGPIVGGDTEAPAE
jgi:hypothetical protein